MHEHMDADKRAMIKLLVKLQQHLDNCWISPQDAKFLMYLTSAMRCAILMLKEDTCTDDDDTTPAA